jgi:hypothetical protein
MNDWTVQDTIRKIEKYEHFAEKHRMIVARYELKIRLLKEQLIPSKQ